MGWLDRLGQAVRAQVNSLIREAEDPEQLLEEAIMAMEQELIQMRQGLAEAIASQKRTEREVQKYEKAAQTWYERAKTALSRGNETLAREALMKRQSYQTYVQPFQTQLQQQQEVVTRLKQDLRQLEHKYSEAKTKKSLYLARLRSAVASHRMQKMMGDLNPNSDSTLFEQIESKIMELEAESQLINSVSSDPLEPQFAALEGKDPQETSLLDTSIESTTSTPKKSNLSSLNAELEKLRSELDNI